MSDKPVYNVLSLFAGIGGLDLGLERAGGCETRWYSEVDPYACEAMAARFPNAVNLGDITTIDWTSIDARPDIICGGFPCQDISCAGTGGGIAEGTRSGLWRQYADAIRVLRPRLVIVENVTALLARGAGRVYGDLAALGYHIEGDCVSACAVGAPHMRHRLFIVAHADSEYGTPRVGAFEQSRQLASQLVRDLEGAWPDPIDGFVARCTGANRVADGIPHVVDRLRCLGNAVVPQVAELVARVALARIA